MTTIKYLDMLRIGPFDVKIKIIDKELGDAQKIWGKYDKDHNIITLNEGMIDPIRAVEILIHEITHAIWYINGIDAHEDSEERVVSTMGVAWAQIFRDNPHLIKWLAKYSKG